MEVSDKGRAFIQGWEECRLTPYRDDAGKWTVGWGYKLGPTDSHNPITQDEADALFDTFILHVEDELSGMIEVAVNQSQFDALGDFAYNCGVEAFEGSMAVRHALNAGDYAGCADGLLLWNEVHDPATGKMVVSAGLDRRRHAERALFLNADYTGNT